MVINYFQSRVRVEYMFNPLTNRNDMTQAVIKFGMNDIIKYPNCLKKIEVVGQQTTSSSSSRSSYRGRYKRTIGKVPNYGAPSSGYGSPTPSPGYGSPSSGYSSSSRSTSWSSSTRTSSSSSTLTSRTTNYGMEV